MFSGIIEELGRVRSITPVGEALRLCVTAAEVSQGVKVSDSVAVNGVCLTVTDVSPQTVSFDVIPETLSKTSLGQLEPGSPVNLERALCVGDRLGGHFVQGHVDATGEVINVYTEGEWYMITVRAPEEVRPYLIPHGSISMDGVSLTVARLSGDEFTVALIPHTLKLTNLGDKKPGDLVNLEGDMIGKYVLTLIRESGFRLVPES
ncbi:MAG TPA: riboflavin synthase [Armatimonadota bacterium]|nr:riboflavin synthase [Armatimonadota bacterium]